MGLNERTIDLEIIPELKEFILPLQKEEYLQLESNIRQEGCREPLIVWKRENRNTLIDGHNRYRICKKHGIPFKISVIHFKSLEEAKIWILNNQLGRRNLNPDQMSYYRGLKYESLKRGKGGYKAVLSKGHKETLTAERLSKEFKVSESTIKRDSKYARGLEFLGKLNPELKNKILTGEISVNKSIINLVSDPVHQGKIKSISDKRDLDNKAEKIRMRIIGEAEYQLKIKSGESLKDFGDTQTAGEPLFVDLEYRFKRIKGMILSNLNKAFRDKDVKALEEIRKLIDRLEDILE